MALMNVKHEQKDVGAAAEHASDTPPMTSSPQPREPQTRGELIHRPSHASHNNFLTGDIATGNEENELGRATPVRNMPFTSSSSDVLQAAMRCNADFQYQKRCVPKEDIAAAAEHADQIFTRNLRGQGYTPSQIEAILRADPFRWTFIDTTRTPTVATVAPVLEYF